MPNPPPTPEALAPRARALRLADQIIGYFGKKDLDYRLVNMLEAEFRREHRQLLVEAARKYDRGHHPGCERLRLSGGPCNCGYDDLRAALAKEP